MRRAIGITTGMLFLTAQGGCGTGGETDLGPLDAEEILGATDHRLGTQETPPLSEVIQILPLDDGPAGDVLLVDLTAPHLHRYDDRGAHLASFGSSGEGPMELRRPWRATRSRDGDVLIAAGGRIHRIAPEPEPREIDRYESPPNPVDLAPVCGGWSSIVLATPEGGRTDQGTYVPRRLDPETGEWRWLASARAPRHPLAPVGRHARVLGADSGFAILNRSARAVEWRRCDEVEPSRSVALRVPEEWNLEPAQTGAARLGDWLVFFWKSSVLAKFDGTHVSAWNPSSGAYVQRRIPDRELVVYHSGSSPRVFLVVNDLAPEVYEISAARLASVLSLPAAGDPD